MEKEDVSNKTVMILAIVAILIVASSLWLVLNKLSDVNSNGQKVITITKVIEQAPSPGGAVGLTILPQQDKGGN